MSQAAVPQQSQPSEGLQALRDACARNSPIEVIRRGRGDQEPAAKGRLIEFRDDCLMIEKVHVIGRDVQYPSGSNIECYFASGGNLLYFRSQIIEAGQPVKLNQQVVVPGMRIAIPETVEEGQRRGVYRTPLGALEALPKIEVWHARDVLDASEQAIADHRAEVARLEPEAAAELPPPPKLANAIDLLPARYQGTVVDASDSGVGVLLPGAVYSRLKMFDHLWIRISFPREENALVLITEVRQTRDIPGLGARLGLLFMRHESMEAGLGFPVRMLVNFINQLRRDKRI